MFDHMDSPGVHSMDEVDLDEFRVKCEACVWGGENDG